MTRGAALAFVIVGVVLLGGAGVSHYLQRPPPEAICTQAADRWEACVLDKVGPSIAGLASSKREEGIPACAVDPKTVGMYRECLPEIGCGHFLKCLEAAVKE